MRTYQFPTSKVGDEKVLTNLRNVAIFDFDGTLTTKDTLLEFIKFACGKWQFYIGFLLYSPILVLMKLHLYPNWKAKQLIFSHYFKGMKYCRFQELGMQFANIIDTFRRKEIIDKLETHINKGDTVYVISASIDEWVRPWCKQYGIADVLGTKIEVDTNGQITGKFLTMNCYGQEKVNRLLQVEPNRGDYCLYAYGDSRGDKEMLEFSEIKHFIE